MSRHVVSGYPLFITVTILILVATCSGGCGPGAITTPTPEPITLRFGFREFTVEIEPLLDEFHTRYPWITVEPVRADRFSNGIETLVRAGTVDMFLDSSSALSYAAEGLIKPLDDLQLADWAPILDDYYQGTWESLRIQGQQWGIPANVDMYVAYVNLDQAQALHLELPGPEWTLFEFLELANAMSFLEGLPYLPTSNLIGFCTMPDAMDVIVLTYRHGGQIVDSIENPQIVTLDDPLTVEAVQWYSDLYNRYGVAPDPDVIRTTFRQGGVFEAQVRGVCGVWFGLYSSRGGLDMPFEWAMKFVMLPLPHDHADFNLANVEGFFIHDESQHPAEAIKLARFLSDRWEAAGTRLPPRRSLVESDGYQANVGSEIGAVALSFSDRVIMLPPDAGPELQSVGAEFIGAVQQIVTEDMDAGTVLSEAQDRARAALQTP
jgi:ABC-type glycerol-3-phosphate transport system substrate-binding protein